MHSALDIDDTRLHEFSSQLNMDDFVKASKTKGSNGTTQSAKLQLTKPIKFHDFSSDGQNNYAGFGLKSVLSIPKDSIILKMSADLGLVSNVLVDDGESNSGN